MSDLEYMEEELVTLLLEMDDGREEEFAILDDEIYVNDQRYALLATVLEGDILSDDPEDYLFMRIETDDTCEEDEYKLVVIRDEEEYEKVIAFCQED